MTATKNIFLLDALRLLEARNQNDELIPCSLEFCTKNGELRFENSVTIAVKKNFKNLEEKKSRASHSRSTNHATNNTRNIQIVGTDEVRTICIWLITKINDMEVIL